MSSTAERRPSTSTCPPGTCSHRAVPVLALALMIGQPLAADTPAAVQAEPEAPLAWKQGPAQQSLGNAQIPVPDGYVSLDADETRRYLRALGNVTGSRERGLLAPADEAEDWFVVFQWDPSGYVKDDERDELDADQLLTSMRAGDEADNEARQKAGFPALNTVGWEVQPAYNPTSNLLEWCLRLESEGSFIINCDLRLLGRRGVMRATLVADPEDRERAMAETRALVSKFEFDAGERYAEYKPGDRLAEYGLKGLLLGGAAAAAVKGGLFKKFGKLLVVGVLGLAALVKRLFDRKSSVPAETVVPPPVLPG
jgi:uncharacterized membrane-anchored protein